MNSKWVLCGGGSGRQSNALAGADDGASLPMTWAYVVYSAHIRRAARQSERFQKQPIALLLRRDTDRCHAAGDVEGDF